LGITIYGIDIPTIEQFVSEHLKEKLRQLKLSDIRLKQNESLREVVMKSPSVKKGLRKLSVCVCREAGQEKRETKTPTRLSEEAVTSSKEESLIH